MRPLVRTLLAVIFIAAGVLHLARPRPYVRIVPEYLPAPAVLVAISGVAEVLGGVGLLVPATRRPAALALIALLIAVFPANIEMAAHPGRAGAGLPSWMLWARLPLQPALIAAVWAVTRQCDAVAGARLVRRP